MSAHPEPTVAPGIGVMVAVIAAGGLIGSLLRYQAGLVWPTGLHDFPWTTLAINVTGCFALGVLIVLVTEKFAAPPLLRPFLGTGVLGGFTTFSTYSVQIQQLLDTGHPGLALSYLVLTAAAAITAGAVAVLLTRRLVRR